ncbi:type II toxin-antitoxin system PemK/MazF family toxin [Bartonella taylorii]|uniref:Type II toxin-antitoxin system PemK/MazF family toxin n=1 Tax=Bartonella taylorii TaxID=33046 RepID=A0A9Q8YWF3_BARTA|nr:type II toxin-antitoxin system PemK/MazF family toxin [Bartonella taylorii]USP02193.1 type II toxin-antitoxin system PemK/MazF family toxin [Bartonella taylorii]
MRGSLVTIAIQGDFGKPRPALIIQANQFSEHTSMTVLPITSTLVDAPLLRITIQPDSKNGLQKPSQVMIDKIMTVRCEKVSPAFGSIRADKMLEIERCLAVFLGIVK